MKKLIIFYFILFFTSCGNNSDTKQKSTTDSTSSSTEVKDPEAAKGLALVAKSDCFTCHKLTEASVGPPYSAIAAKYKTLTPPAMDSMVEQIIKGGKGRWGIIPMTAHPAVPRQEAELMVHYIMSIKP